MSGHTETGDEAYRLACESGLVSKTRLDVLRIIIQNPGITGGEVSDLLGRPREWSSPCFAVLSDLGLIEQDGTRIYAPTGKSQKAWRATGRAPIKRPSRVGPIKKLHALEREAAFLRAEQTRLQGLVAGLEAQLVALQAVA